MKITKDLLRLLRSDIDAALSAVGTKHGIQLKAGNVTFTDLNATFKLEVSTLTEGGAAISKERANLLHLRQQLGLTEENLNQVIMVGGEAHVLDGYINTGREKPYQIRRLSDNKLYLIDYAVLHAALTAKPAPKV